jgi:hypothetical protein
MLVRVDDAILPIACSPVDITNAACFAVESSNREYRRRSSTSKQPRPPLASITSRQPYHTRRYISVSGTASLVWPAKSYRANNIEWAISAEGCELCREDEGKEGGSELTRMSTTAEDTVRYELNAVD